MSLPKGNAQSQQYVVAPLPPTILEFGQSLPMTCASAAASEGARTSRGGGSWCRCQQSAAGALVVAKSLAWFRIDSSQNHLGHISHCWCPYRFPKRKLQCKGWLLNISGQDCFVRCIVAPKKNWGRWDRLQFFSQIVNWASDASCMGKSKPPSNANHALESPGYDGMY